MNDLETRLRTLTEQTPAGSADLERVVARGRTVRRRRYVVRAVVGILAVVGAAGVVASLVGDPAPPPPFVEDVPGATASPDPGEATPSPQASENGDQPVVGEVALDDVELPLGLIDAAGLDPNDRAHAPLIDEPVTVAFADGDGGVVYQREDDPRSIYWRHADGTEEDPVTVEPGPTTLVGAVRWEGDLYVAFSATVPEAEVPTVRLMLHRRPPPGSGELLATYTTDIEVDGGIEGVALLPDGRLVASVCHLMCTFEAVDLSAAGDQDPLQATEFHRPEQMTWGLDGTDDGEWATVVAAGPDRLEQAWLELGAGRPGQGGEGADEGDAQYLSSMSIDLPIEKTTDGAWVQVASDGTAAIVELREGGQTVTWLLVDGLDDRHTRAPRVRRITGVEGRLVLLDEPPTAP